MASMLGLSLRSLGLGAALSCGANEPALGGGPPAAPPGAFATTAGPALERSCATPPCHGNDARPLRVYAAGLHRADPSRRHLDEPLSPPEVRANEDRAAAFLAEVARAEDSLLVAKPLGRATHLGGVLCDGPDAEPCRSLLAWARSAGLP